MKVICLLCDSLNRHFLGAYGTQEAETPNIDRLASMGHVFTRHFSGSVPTMPTRRELWTGNYEFLWRPWGSLEPWDRDLPRVLREHDVLTMLITDSYHLFEAGSGNYHFAFEGWEFFRGFENDPWVTEPTEIPPHKGHMTARYARNMRRMQRERDLPPVKTLTCVEEWLQANHMHERFFLMVDEFAPHEPFNAPEYMVKKYDHEYTSPLFFWPKYGRGVHTEEEIRHLRAAYAAHVTLIDKYLGRIFDTMDRLDMWKDTAFILMTDHGHYLGEHGYTGKPACPPYNTLVHIPCIMYVPDTPGNGTRIHALSANVDVYATILDLFDIRPESEIHGRSLLPLLRGETERVREWTLYGYFGRQVNVTDGRAVYMRVPRGEDPPLYIYSLRWEFGKFTGKIPPIDDSLELGRFMKNAGMPVMRLRIPGDLFMRNMHEACDHLYLLDEDPGQEHNLAGSPEEETYVDLLKRAMREVAAPEEQFERLDL